MTTYELPSETTLTGKPGQGWGSIKRVLSGIVQTYTQDGDVRTDSSVKTRMFRHQNVHLGTVSAVEDVEPREEHKKREVEEHQSDFEEIEIDLED